MKKRKDGRYCKQILIGYHEDGRRNMVSIYGKTIKQGGEREILMQIEAEKYAKNNITVKEWADIWLKTYKKNLKPNTYNIYRYCISGHFTDIKDIPLQKLTVIHLYKANVDIKSAQRLLCHVSSQVTLDIYTHLQKGEELKSVKNQSKKIYKWRKRKKSSKPSKNKDLTMWCEGPDLNRHG